MGDGWGLGSGVGVGGFEDWRHGARGGVSGLARSVFLFGGWWVVSGVWERGDGSGVLGVCA